MVLSGCAHYNPAPIDAKVSASQYQSRSLKNSALTSFVSEHFNDNDLPWPPAEWDLDSLTVAAFYYHPDLEVARAQMAVASANVQTAGMRPNPDLNVRPSFNETTTVPTPWIVAGGLNFPIETAGRRSIRISQAEHLEKSAQLDVASRAWTIRSQVRTSYLELWSASQLSYAQTQRFEAQREIVAFLDTRYQAGEVSRVEVSREQLELERARMAATSARNADLIARTRLAGAIGVSTDALQEITFDFGIFKGKPIDLTNLELRRAALFNRADIISGLEAYAAAESALRLEIARQYPNIMLNPGHNYDQGDKEWRLGLTVSLPILNQNQGPIATAEAQRKLRAAEFRRLQASVLVEIESALASYQAAIEISQSAESTLQEAETQLNLAGAMYRAGEFSGLDTSLARIQNAFAMITFIEAKIRVQQSLTQLELASQIPLENETWSQLIPKLPQVQ